MEHNLILLRFLDIFIHYWRSFMYKLLYFHQTFTDCGSYIDYWYVKIPDMTASLVTPFDFIAFLGLLIHYLGPFMSELLYLHQTFTDYMSNQYTRFRYVNMPNVTPSYGRFYGLIGFFRNLNVWYVILHQTFINFVES